MVTIPLETGGGASPSLAFAYPDDWIELEGMLGSLVACIAPADDSDPRAFRANFNVVVQSPESPEYAEELQAQHGAGLDAALDDVRIIDAGLTTVAELAASRALVTYSLDGDDLTLEQWLVPVGRRTLVLSATATNLDYARFAADFHDIVGSVDLDA